MGRVNTDCKIMSKAIPPPYIFCVIYDKEKGKTKIFFEHSEKESGDVI